MTDTELSFDDMTMVRRRLRKPPVYPIVTIQRGGSIGLNEASTKALGNVRRVRLAWRADPPTLGIRGTTDDDADGYILQRNGRGTVVNARGALAELGIALDLPARRFPAVAKDGALIAVLTGSGEPVSNIGARALES